MKNIEPINNSEISIPCISNDGHGPSMFSSRNILLEGSSQRMLSAQIDAVNFRLRSSDSDYASDWHVAGDPTLLIVLSGVVRIELRTGEFKDFSKGTMFVAQDYLALGVDYDDTQHGHRAEIIGGQPAQLLHLKLSKR